MKIGIGADHRGFRLKLQIIEFLKKKGYRIVDYGTNSEDSSDYPVFGFSVARNVAKKRIKLGILLCYSGQGMAITANKLKGVRAVVVWRPEIAALSRAHNDANILVIPAGFIRTKKVWQSIIDNFLNTKFEGGRHQRRLKIIKKYEKNKRLNS